MTEFIPNDTLIGRYRILAPIGQGGMATVYKAIDTVLERDVALKLIRTEQFPPIILETVLKRFEREAKALARMNHPNIVKIYDYGKYENAPYLVMDFLPGQSFKQVQKPVPYKLAIHLIRPIAGALAYAHRQGIYHRDVKPGNIMLTLEGIPVLTDFGIAKLLDTNEGNTLTASGVGIGTPEYMAPEQGVGGEIDGRADQYSLAVVLYELITAHKPFQGDTPMAVVLKQHTESLPPIRDFVPDVPESVENVIQRALAKSPDQRFPDMTSFTRVLEDTLLPANNQPSVATPDPTESPVSDSQPHSKTTSGEHRSEDVSCEISQSAITVSEPVDAPIAEPQLRSEVTADENPRADNVSGNSQPLTTTTVPDIMTVSDTQPRSEIKNNGQTQTPRKNKFSSTDWIILLVLLIAISILSFMVDHWMDSHLSRSNNTVTHSTKTFASQPTGTPLPLLSKTVPLPTKTFTPIPTAAPTSTVSPKAIVLKFLDKKQYASLGSYIHDIPDPTLKKYLEQVVYDRMLNDGIRLTRFRNCIGTLGYINTLGDVIVEPQLYRAEDFSDGLALIQKNGKYGYINTRGEIVIELQFDNAWDFSDGLAIVQKNGKYGYVNTIGEAVIELQFDNAWDFSDGLALVENNGKYGYINTQGNYVVEPQFDNAGGFSEGLAWVVKNDKFGYINTQGNFIVEPQFDNAGDFSDGLAWVVKNDIINYINTQGNNVINPQFDQVWTFSNGLAQIEKNGKFGYINTLGETVIEAQLDQVWDFSNRLALVEENGKFGYINTQGNFVVEPKFDAASSFSDSLAPVKKNNKWGYINTQGDFVIKPQFDDAGDFSEGMAPIMINDKYGYINTIVEIIIEPQFDDAESFYNGLARVLNNDATYFIDPTGETVFVACQR